MSAKLNELIEFGDSDLSWDGPCFAVNREKLCRLTSRRVGASLH